jgi:CHAT domain-containing protein/Tfp pilus assembly protein PilF
VDVLAERRRTLGDDDPETIWSIADLASVYVDLGRYPEAEPLFREAFDRRRKLFGEVHPDTLSSLQNLGALFEAVGRYADADQAYRQVLEKRRASLGDVHPDTLGSALGLGRVLSQESRFGEAEVLLKSTIEAIRTTPQVSQSDLIVGLNDLAALYVRQSRYEEAETLFREVLDRNRALLGDDHSNTLTSLNNLGFVIESQGRLAAEAEPIYREALDRRRKVLGPHHPETLVSINNLGLLLLGMDRLADAEPLLKEALDKSSEILGDNHPNTIITLQNFGVLLEKLGRLGEAEPIYRLALERMRGAQGEDHPSTVEIEMNLVDILIQQQRTDEAVAHLDLVGQSMLRRIGIELASTRQERVRRLLLERQSKYQNTVIALAEGTGAPTALRLAADVILQFKGLAGEEEGFLAQLMNRANDDRVVSIARQILDIRGALAAAFHQDADAVPPLLARIEDAEGRLSSISTEFREAQSVQAAGSMDVEKALPEGSLLVEFRLYRLFEDDVFGPPRIAAVLLSHDKPPRLADLGPVDEAEAALKALNGPDKSLSARATEQLSEMLLGAFKSELKAARRVYLAPDGLLNLVPFTQLPFGGAEHWITAQDIRVVQSGRALVRARGASGSQGLVAIGGVDYGDAGNEAITVAAADSSAKASDDIRGFTEAGDALRRSLADFRPLPNSVLEIDFITGLYRVMREGEPITVWEGADAKEGRVKSLSEPPRVLHLATHGFYLASKGEVERPMLLSGLPLAGANRGLAGTLDADGEDGILYAIEAMGLNLHGSELVVLSACDTAKGTVDYSEGVYGLSRAFRIAGADNVLITLWPLYDTRAREFMEDFYTLWLREYDDPADALIATQRYWAASSDPQRSDPIAWAPFVLVQNGL